MVKLIQKQKLLTRRFCYCKTAKQKVNIVGNIFSLIFSFVRRILVQELTQKPKALTRRFVIVKR